MSAFISMAICLGRTESKRRSCEKMENWYRVSYSLEKNTERTLNPANIFSPENVVCFLCLLHAFKCPKDNIFSLKQTIWASMRENPSSGVWEQQRSRPAFNPRTACASAQSDQHLCYSLKWEVSYLDLLRAKFQFSS